MTGPEGGLFRGMAALVATGALLGLAQNYLLRQGGPSRGLPWIAEDKVLPQLESFQSAAAASPVPSPIPVVARLEPPPPSPPPHPAASPKPSPKPKAPAPSAALAPAEPPAYVPPDMNDPMGIAAVAPGDGLPAIPDLGRPLQMQLPAVKKFFDAQAATIVDARDPEEYAEGHIPGAINLPYDQVITDPERIEAFDPKGKPTIVYCGGGTCEVSMNLAFRMVEAGKKHVLVFMGGWPEWQAAGYPVAKGAR